MPKIPLVAAVSDRRGEIFDLIRNEAIHAVTLITFTEGTVRGNHWHEQSVQWIYVLSGRIRLVTQLPGEAVEDIVLGPGDFAVTREHERHALQGLEQSSMLEFTRGAQGGDTHRLDQPLIFAP